MNILSDRETCGDTLLGEGCEQGRWYGYCAAPDCAGMCRYVGRCLCLGCGSWRCCRRFDEGASDGRTVGVRRESATSCVTPDSGRTTVMKITINKTAGPSERFAKDCLEGQIGKQLWVRAGTFNIGTAQIVDYDVIDDGREILISMDIDMGGLRPATINLDTGLEAGL